MEVDGEGGEV